VGALAAAGPPPTGPACTRDGQRVALRANLGAPGDLDLARRVGADGCGLLRTELLYAGRRQAPTVEEQAAAYGRLARDLDPLVVRLFDAGGDKPLAFLPAGEPPARGLRLLLRNPGVLADQLRAVALARQQSGAEVRALVPMVVDPTDLAQVARLAPGTPAAGAMVETPAAALMARELAAAAAFLSVGTNDLEQYVLADDRAAGRRRGLVHPAVLRLIQQVALAAAAAGVECAVCGELAGDPLVAPCLVGLGVRSLSMAPARIPGVRRALGCRSLEEHQQLGQQAAALADAGAVGTLLRGQQSKERP
jgi:phosphotransferase system enzyme I (PtsI)